MPEARIYHNPRCSKSRGCLQILEERGVETQIVRYLEEVPSRSELEWLWQRLGTAMLRESLPGNPDQILDFLEKDPNLIERPIVIMGNRAVVARPPEKVLELLMERQ